jgi:hypothetical protein
MRGSVRPTTASQPNDPETCDLKPRGVFGEVELRQETYCLLPYKLPIHDFRNVQDFVSGVICILKGYSLYSQFVPRDIDTFYQVLTNFILKLESSMAMSALTTSSLMKTWERQQTRDKRGLSTLTTQASR